MFAKTLTLALVAASTSAIKIKASSSVPDWCDEPMYGLPQDEPWTDETFRVLSRAGWICSGV